MSWQWWVVIGVAVIAIFCAFLAAEWTGGDYAVKRKAMAGIICFVAWVGGYIAMHIYFIVEAFKRMATWSAIVTIIPVIGDILFAVLCVLDGKWWPLVFVLLVIGLKESDKRYTLNMF